MAAAASLSRPSRVVSISESSSPGPASMRDAGPASVNAQIGRPAGRRIAMASA